MWNPDVRKRLKEFDDRINEKLANNEIIADAEYSPEGWQLDANDIENPHMPYDLEFKMP